MPRQYEVEEPEVILKRAQRRYLRESGENADQPSASNSLYNVERMERGWRVVFSNRYRVLATYEFPDPARRR
jgi:hypothetical protein